MHPTVTVVSLGPGAPELLTLGALEQLRRAKQVILRTERHGCVPFLTEQGISFTTLDDLYETCEDFDSLNHAIAKRLWAAAASTPVTYAVMDASCDASVEQLIQTAPTEGQVTILPGVTAAQSCLASLPHELPASGDGLRTIPALSLSAAVHDPRLPLLITEIDNPVLAGDVKLWLMELYREEQPIAFFPPSEKAARRVQILPLWELDHQKRFGHTCCAYVPASPVAERERFCFADLVEIMTTLRGPSGCPWDRQQTHASLRPYLLEEAYEAVDAITSGDDERIADELGDVLLQIAFHGQIAKEHGAFTTLDITTAICAKMLRRHPHIFAGTGTHSLEESAAIWEAQKKAEKHLTSQSEAMRDITPGLPSLMRAYKVQRKAAQVGFDWDAPLDALPKICEEAEEVRAELTKGADPAEELGDLLFSCVNVARLCGQQPELLLQSATEKFIRRFESMENLIKKAGKSLEGLTLSEMDVYWKQVKAAEKHA